MNRYVYVGSAYATNFSQVIQILDTEEGMPTAPIEGVSGVWVDATGNTTVQVGWKAFQSWQPNGTSVYVFVELTDEDHLVIARTRLRKELDDAVEWLNFHPLHYKHDLGIATSEEEAKLLAYKQYFVALGEVNNQPGYPASINWPVIPF
ncbi:tail fiber assembly protein [Pseudomonas sp. MWU16-30322]|uniref:tail fiber assembly protein n=1 Tax=Pseudomonas sp. MWU16-30322 TaxID=2878092 RepID=UPI001CFAC3B4|nr:tail fiber assembly protein [Pseudomonas sp. MWU16-30322]